MSAAAIWVGVAISAGSLVVAIIALVKSSRAQDQAVKAHTRATEAQEKAAEAQQQVAEIEQARERDRKALAGKAELTARIESDWSAAGRANPRLVIGNTGQAEAREVAVTVDGKAVLDHPAIPRGETEVCRVGPQSSFRYILAFDTGACPRLDVEISWKDDSGEPGQYRTTVTL